MVETALTSSCSLETARDGLWKADTQVVTRRYSHHPFSLRPPIGLLPSAWLSVFAFVWDLFPLLLTYCSLLLRGWVCTLNPPTRWLASLWSMGIHRPAPFSAALTPALAHLHSLWRERRMRSSSTTWWRRLSAALNDKALLQWHQSCNASSKAGPLGTGAP